LQGVIVAVRGRALVPIAVLLVAATATACSKAEGASSGTTTAPKPSIVIPRSQPADKAAADCTKSTETAAASDMDGVQLDVSTDASRTSLLVKNTGSLTVIVVPDANFTTRLIAAPYASPADQASRAALVAVNGSRGVGSVHDLPANLPATMVVILPPQWAVCGLTDTVGEIAAVRYLRDKTTSAQYFVAKGLSDQLIPRVSATRARATLNTCARGTTDLLKGSPTLSDIQLYAELLSPGTPCRNGYKALLGSDEKAAQQTTSMALNALERAPRLLGDTKLFGILATG
jgi:hypothetical protein